MSFIAALPLWALALFIFGLRVVDVSLGTVRTLAIVSGRLKAAVLLGFVEVLIWITVVSQVISRIQESPWVALAFAAGFAAGNAAGIYLERRLAFGEAMVGIFSPAGREIAAALREAGQAVTTVAGEGRDGPVTLSYVWCPRRRIDELVTLARRIDPHLFFVVERADAWHLSRRAIGHPTGWRSTAKKK